MCIQCHKMLSDNDIEQQMQRSLKEMNDDLIKTCDEYNTTSLSHIFIVCAGYNGTDCQNIAFKVMSKFIEYASIKSDYGASIPKNGLEKMPSINKLERIDKVLQDYWKYSSENNLSREMIKYDIEHDLIEKISNIMRERENYSCIIL